MSDPIRYLTIAELVMLHDEVVARCGGAESPLVDLHRLDSALNRPQQAAWYEGADLIRQSVLLVIGISQAQAFLDGNKRTALAAFDVFLRLNGVTYQGEALPLARWIEAIAEAERSNRDSLTGEFGSWLRGFVSPQDCSIRAD